MAATATPLMGHPPVPREPAFEPEPARDPEPALQADADLDADPELDADEIEDSWPVSTQELPIVELSRPALAERLVVSPLADEDVAQEPPRVLEPRLVVRPRAGDDGDYGRLASYPDGALEPRPLPTWPSAPTVELEPAVPATFPAFELPAAQAASGLYRSGHTPSTEDVVVDEEPPTDPGELVPVKARRLRRDGSRLGPPPASRHRRRRSRLRRWLITIGVIVWAAAAGLGVLTLQQRGLFPAPPNHPSGTAEPAQRGPGIEPPSAGDWPVDWPEFQPTEATRSMSGLPGVGFAFRVPAAWDCVRETQTLTFARYTCGARRGQPDEIGGDLIVRTCPEPCGGDVRVAMREREEAWGLQWIRAGSYVAWAQTTNFVGPPHYGLVVVGYWRSVPDGAIDRQVVLRLTGPAARTNDLRKVGNDIHAAIA